MPRSSKKKKDKVADFSKSKLKLGKGKALANNAIDTSFKARSIILPTQSLALEKDESEPITKRHLTFGDLISSLKHYNANARKDAILGLRELLNSHWNLVNTSFGILVNSVVRIIGDEDAGVRKQLLAFLSWILPRIPREVLVPHSSLLLLFATSAQTHIFPEIRIDAVRFLDIFLECIPEAVIVGWCDNGDEHGSRVLGGYLGILNAGTKYGETGGSLKATSTASVVLTPASKLVVLRSLSVFLNRALSHMESVEIGNRDSPLDFRLNAWFMKDAFLSLESFLAFEKLLEPVHQDNHQKRHAHPWASEVDTNMEFVFSSKPYSLLGRPLDEPWALQELGNMADSVSTKRGSQKADISFVAHLTHTLHSTLVESYLDCAPSVFSPGGTPPEAEVQLILTILRIIRTLYNTIFQSAHEKIDTVQVQHLESIIDYMYPYFPASSNDHKLDQSYEEFNLVFCELTSLLISDTSRTLLSRQKKSQSKTKSSPKRDGTLQTESVTRYVLCRLRGEGISAMQIAQPLSPSGYIALLPTIWALINAPTLDQGANNDILFATLDHGLKLTSKSASKRLTVEFIARLVMLDLEPSYRGEFRIGQDAAVAAKFDAWLLHLPQVLWELSNTHLLTTETILRVLLRVLQRQARITSQSETMASLQSRLMPYFHIEHASRGALPGPYTKLPPSSGPGSCGLRFLVLDVIATVLTFGGDTKPFDGLANTVGLAITGEAEQSYWAHGKAMRVS